MSLLTVSAVQDGSVYDPDVADLSILLLVYLGLWISAACIPAVMARSRGREPFGWFTIGLVISPLLAAIAVAVLPKLAEISEGAAATMRRCPSCAELVQPAAIICRHCGRELPVVDHDAYPPEVLEGWYRDATWRWRCEAHRRRVCSECAPDPDQRLAQHRHASERTVVRDGDDDRWYRDSAWQWRCSSHRRTVCKVCGPTPQGTASTSRG